MLGALQDFDKLSVASAKKEDVQASSTPSEEEKAVEVVTPDETWSQDFIKQTAEQFEKNMQGLFQNGNVIIFLSSNTVWLFNSFCYLGTGGDFEGSLQKMAQTVASAMSSGSTGETEGDGTDFQSAIAQALKDISATSENLQVF